jgi:hypoxanthine phosphoribosyltransferase
MMQQPEVLYPREQIATRVRELGEEITRSFDGRELTVVALMKGCLMFTADLVREIPLDMTCHFLRAAAHTEGGAHTVTDIVYSTEIPYTDKDILLIEDIVDTGITLRFLLDQIQDRRPRSLRVCTLVNKPALRKIDVHPDWAAFTAEDSPGRFLVGYGLDWDERYRALPYIGTIARPSDPARSLETRREGM